MREFAAQIGHSGKLDFICGQQSKQKVTGMWDNLPRNSKGVLKPSKVHKLVVEEYNKLEFPVEVKLLRENLKGHGVKLTASRL